MPQGQAGGNRTAHQARATGGSAGRSRTDQLLDRHRAGVTEPTAPKHIEHILAKLGLSTRAQMAAWAVERRLLAVGSS
jgi:hypothetical protein